MYSNRSGKMLGLLYLAPALLFVAIFTAYPLGQMIWMSFHNWSIIEPARWVGPANYVKAWNDHQFWVSLGFTLKYTLYLTPILMIGGYLIALLVSTNTRTRKITRGIVFVPVVIGLSVSSLLWYWLFSYHYGLINQGLMDLGLIDKPIVWFGESADRALWAVIVSIVWKVVGFGMLLFVAAIQAIPPDINEAAMADGASYWQRVRRITAAADGADDPAGHAVQRHRLAARLRPVLPDDGRPALQPHGVVGLLALPQLLPVPEARLRRGALADPGGDHPRLHGRADVADASDACVMP